MAALNTPRVLWVALLISTFLYLVALYTIHPHAQGPLNPMFPPMFGVLGLGSAVASFVLPGSMYKRGVTNSQLQITYEPDPNPSSDVFPMGNEPERKVFANAQAARRRALVLFQTTFIQGMALSETVALFGFMLAFLGYPLVYWAPFFPVTWVLFAVRFPTEDAVFGRFARTYGAAFPSGG